MPPWEPPVHYVSDPPHSPINQNKKRHNELPFTQPGKLSVCAFIMQASKTCPLKAFGPLARIFYFSFMGLLSSTLSYSKPAVRAPLLVYVYPYSPDKVLQRIHTLSSSGVHNQITACIQSDTFSRTVQNLVVTLTVSTWAVVLYDPNADGPRPRAPPRLFGSNVELSIARFSKKAAR